MSNLQNIMDARSKLKNDEVQGKIDASQALRPTAANPVIKTPSPIDIAAPDTARGAIQEASNRGAFNVQATTEAPRTNGMSAQDRSDMLAAQQEESLRMTGQDDQTQNALAESRRFFSGIEETGLTQSDLMRITGATDAQTARAMIEGRGGLTAEQQLELNQAMEQAKFDITKSKNEADLLTEEARIKQDVTDRFAPEFTKAKEAGQRTSESAFRIAGRAGMGSKSEDQQQQINDRQLEIEQSIAAEQRMEERMAIASARGASAEELETLSSQLNNAKAQRQEYQQNLELQQAGLDAAALDIATEREKQIMKDSLDAAQTGFVLNPETGQYEKDPNFTQPEDYIFEMQVDSDGNTTQIRTNKNTNEIITTSLGQIGKGTASKFQTQFNPVTGEQVIFDPSTGNNIARISPFNQSTQLDITSTNPTGSTDVAQYSQIYMGSSANAAGVDLAGQPNSPIKSNVSGEVLSAGNAGGWGNQVRIKDSEGNVHQFSHLNSIDQSIIDALNNNQSISASGMIGLMGNTGNVMAGDGSALTPEQLAQGRGTHLDYTVYKPDGSMYNVGEAANFLGLNTSPNTGDADKDLAEEFIMDKAGGDYKKEIILRHQIEQNGGKVPSSWVDDKVSALSTDLLKEPSFKEAQEAVGGFDTATQGFLQQNGFGDIAMVNGYQRIIDPGAAVRGEDVKTQSEAVSYVQTALNIKGKIFAGDKMLPEVREIMLKAVADQYNKKIANFNGAAYKRFKARADNLGIPFELVGEKFPEQSVEIFKDKANAPDGQILIERNGERGYIPREEVSENDIIL